MPGDLVSPNLFLQLAWKEEYVGTGNLDLLPEYCCLLTQVAVSYWPYNYKVSQSICVYQGCGQATTWSRNT